MSLFTAIIHYTKDALIDGYDPEVITEDPVDVHQFKAKNIDEAVGKLKFRLMNNGEYLYEEPDNRTGDDDMAKKVSGHSIWMWASVDKNKNFFYAFLIRTIRDKKILKMEAEVQEELNEMEMLGLVTKDKIGYYSLTERGKKEMNEELEWLNEILGEGEGDEDDDE